MNNNSWSIIANFSCYCCNMCSIGYLRLLVDCVVLTPLSGSEILNQVQHDVVDKSGEVRNIWFLWQQSFAGGCPLA